MTRKTAVLQAAKELFGECGYADTTFKKIARRAGVAPGLVAHHFGSKDNLFLECGLDVLRIFLERLQEAVDGAQDGYAGIMSFCRAYLDFSLDADSHWLVLVRCSPYSDMKTAADWHLMTQGFAKIHKLLEKEIDRGSSDGSLRKRGEALTPQVIVSLLVGANRTWFLTPYASPALYENVLHFISEAIRNE